MPFLKPDNLTTGEIGGLFKQGPRKRPVRLGLVLFALTFSLLVGACEAVESDSGATQSLKTPTPNADGVIVMEFQEGDSPEKPIKVSAKSLYKDREGNPIRFKEKYARPFGKWLEINGTVKGIGEDSISMEELRPGLGLSSKFGVMKVSDSPEGRDLILAATKGKSLTVKCYMELQGAGMGERYGFSLCTTP